MKKVMTGNEAVVRGAFEAGVKVAAAYPGTPSTEILETIAREYKNTILNYLPPKVHELKRKAFATGRGEIHQA
jgi:indolepyruvate ferredoxin oxidoreductase, alpha subunit